MVFGVIIRVLHNRLTMSRKTLCIATRNSPLALWQAEYVRAQLQALHPSLTVSLLPLTTAGDRFLESSLVAAGGKGLFVKELEEALFDGRADIAVHSLKDMPAVLPEGLQIGAFCERADPGDVLVSRGHRTLAELPAASRIGTASLRRQSQLLRLRPDVTVDCLRGNLQTRLSRLGDGGFDAIVLAAAGLTRLGLDGHISEIFSPENMVPACGQGVLAVECRLEDPEVAALLAPLHHPATARCVETERRVNQALGGSCRAPLGIHCQETHQTLSLHVRVLSPCGKDMMEERAVGKTGAVLADICVNRLLARGAASWLNP